MIKLRTITPDGAVTPCLIPFGGGGRDEKGSAEEDNDDDKGDDDDDDGDGDNNEEVIGVGEEGSRVHRRSSPSAGGVNTEEMTDMPEKLLPSGRHDFWEFPAPFLGAPNAAPLVSLSASIATNTVRMSDLRQGRLVSACHTVLHCYLA